jgi:hypothetical protein
MSDPGLNAPDPVADVDAERIGPMDDSLPEPPDHEVEIDEADQDEPERTEVPDAVLD